MAECGSRDRGRFTPVGVAATLSYLAGAARVRRRELESPAAVMREPAAPARALRWVTSHVMVPGPTETAVVVFVVNTIRRNQRFPLLLAVYVGIALTFVVASIGFTWLGTGAGDGTVIGAILRRRLFAGEQRPGLDVLSAALLSVPLVLSFFTLVGLRILFTIPSELPANWVFRMTEQKDTARYLRGVRHVMRLAVVPIMALTLPAYWVLWGATLAVGHTVLWVLLATVLVELLLVGFEAVPFTSRMCQDERTSRSSAWCISWRSSDIPSSPRRSPGGMPRPGVLARISMTVH